jgi:predicted TIM-barrel fold metal-dependent hydrolase
MTASLDWFDANVQLGKQAILGPGTPIRVPELLAEMDRVGISRALVFHAHAAAIDPRQGNQFLMDEIAGQARLTPAWVLTHEFHPEPSPPVAWCDELLASGVRAARLLPREQLFELRVWNLDNLLDALEERRIPVWVDYGQSGWGANPTDWNGLAEVLTAFPKLPVVLVRPDVGSGRRLFALMEQHLNLYIETSYYSVHQGLAEICRLFGARRVLFGSGMPHRAAGPALTAVLYQPLSDEDRRLIAGANLERLLSEVH